MLTSSMAVFAFAGGICATPPGEPRALPFEVAHPADRKGGSTILWMRSLRTGLVAVPEPPAGPSPRFARDTYDTFFADPRFDDIYENLNLSIAYGGCYDLDPITPCWTAAWTFGLSTNGTDRPAPSFDPGTPTDPNDDYRTDMIIDDYEVDPRAWPADDLETRVRHDGLSWAYLAENTEPFPGFDVGTCCWWGTCSDCPNMQADRENILRVIWWSINNGGTPGDPSDDEAIFEDGVEFAILIEGGMNGTNQTDFIAYLNQDLSDIGGLLIPGRGFITYDWENIAPGSTSHDEGVGFAPAGGDIGLNPTSPFDGLPIPHPDQLSRGVGTNDPASWMLAPTIAPPADPTLDGDPSSVSPFDAVTGALRGLGWNYALSGFNTGPNGDADSNLAHTIPIAIRFIVGPCPADLTGSNDPNDPTYAQPDGDADSDDYLFFLDAFAAADLPICDFTGSSDPNDPTFAQPDGVCDSDDFFFYLDQFALGCP